MGVLRDLQTDIEVSAMRLFAEYRALLLAEAKGMGVAWDEAEDLVMITFEKFLANKDNFNPSKGELIGYLKKILHNTYVTSLRKKKSRIDTVYVSAEDLQFMADRIAAGEMSDSPEDQEDDKLVRQAIASLSPKVREAIMLHYFEEKSIAETAVKLGISENAVKNRLFVARKALAKKLKGKLGKALAILGVCFLGFGVFAAAGGLSLLSGGDQSAALSEAVSAEAPVAATAAIEESSRAEPVAPTTTFENNENTETKGEEPMKFTKTLKTAAMAALALGAVNSAEADEEKYLLAVDAGADGTVKVTANGQTADAEAAELWLTNGTPVNIEYVPNTAGDWRYLSGAPAGAKFSSPTIVSFAMPADACEVTAVPFAYSDDNLACMDNTVQVKTVGPRKVYVFTNASAGAMMVALRRQLTFEEGLVVGGGGSGGQDASGGGGGGVVRLSDVHVLPAASALTVEVGAGGVLADWNSPADKAYGKNSRYVDARGETVALGGGASGGAGGSGSSAGSGTAGQGHDGGKICQTSPWPSGGGGGAEENGADGAIVDGVATGGKGGDGRWDSITGEAHCYGSGGGAGGGGASGEGGAESGGRGACSSAGIVFSNGVNGLGGGGGGSNRGGVAHGGKVRGGNGTVILAFTVGDTTARHAEFDAFDSYPMIDGAATPTPTVKVAGTTLTRGEDYDLVYERNTEANRLAYVTIVGKNDYADVYARQPFYPKSVKFVSPNGSDTASGDSWAEAWTANKAAAELAGGTFNELWFASGTYGTNTFSRVLTLSREIALRGGFAADEADLARKAGKTVFDGEGYRDFATFVNVTFAAANVKDQKVSINDITFTRSWGTALKKSKTAVLELNRCTFEHCGLWQMGASGEPVNMAVSIDDNGGQAVRLTDCVFRGNYSWSGNWTGNLISTLNAAVSFEGCDFVTNGVPFTAAYNASYYATYDSLISSAGGRMSFNRCRFVGNRQHARGTWSLIKAGSGTGADALTVEHCLFVGNEAMNNSDSSSGSYSGGLIYLNQWTAGANSIRNCTFAYNLIDTTFGACVGVGGSSGATIENCVFHGMVTTPRHGGNPIAVLNNSTGKVTVRYSLLDNLTDARSLGAGETDLSVGVKTGDPLFVTPSIEGLYTNGGAGKLYFNLTDETLAEVLNLDVHLKSAAGYRVNGDAEWHTAEGAVSAAIDLGNPADDFSAEAEPNGGRINAGAYGGTAEASKTAECSPEIVEVAVTFPTPYTQPQVAVELGGEGAYSATVRILISTNQLDWSEAIVKEFTAVGNGDCVEWLSPKFLEENSKFYLRVELEAAGADPVSGEDGPYDVEGEMPPWAGKGGDPEQIVHVRADATGLGDGTSWADACTNLFEALGHLSATRHTLWLSGDFELGDLYNGSSISQPSQLDIRGGFSGIENTPEEREEGALSTVDACNKADGFIFAGAEGAVMRIERVRFVHAKEHGFGCSGSLYATNCVFAHNNATRKTIAGRGLCVSPARTVVLSKCTVADNVNPEQTRWQEAGGNGIGVYVSHKNSAPIVIDNCLFVSNGVPHYSGATNTHNVGAVAGAALNVEHASRVTIRNSRFIGNRTIMNGAICDFMSWGNIPYEVKGCLFVGNESVGAAASPLTARLFRLSDSYGAEALFENNTFAYNLADTTDQGLGIGYTGGRLVVRNCIFCGDRNRGGDLCEIFGSSTQYSTPTSVVSYSIFPTTNFFSVAGQTAADVIGEGVIYGDARLVSTTNEFAKLVIKGNNNRLSLDWDNKAAEIMAINAHLRGGAYVDEVTGEQVAGKGKVSPCINTGDPASDYRQEPKPNGRRVNMGCYGNTPWATCSTPGMAVRVR